MVLKNLIKTIENISNKWNCKIIFFQKSIDLIKEYSHVTIFLRSNLKKEIENLNSDYYIDNRSKFGYFMFNKYDFNSDQDLDFKLYGLALIEDRKVIIYLEQLKGKHDIILYTILHEIGHLENGQDEVKADLFADQEFKELLKGKYE